MTVYQTSQTLHKLLFGLEKIADRALQEKLNLTFSQFRILSALNNEHAVSQKDIAQFWDMTEAAVSRQIEILVDKKLISIEIDKTNRRKNILQLTPRGKNLLQKALSVLQPTYERIYKPLSADEKRIFQEILEKLIPTICPDSLSSACHS